MAVFVSENEHSEGDHGNVRVCSVSRPTSRSLFYTSGPTRTPLEHIARTYNVLSRSPFFQRFFRP